MSLNWALTPPLRTNDGRHSKVGDVVGTTKRPPQNGSLAHVRRRGQGETISPDCGRGSDGGKQSRDKLVFADIALADPRQESPPGFRRAQRGEPDNKRAIGCNAR